MLPFAPCKRVLRLHTTSQETSSWWEGGAVGNSKPFSRDLLICACRASPCGAVSCVNAFIAERNLCHEHVHRRVDNSGMWKRRDHVFPLSP